MVWARSDEPAAGNRRARLPFSSTLQLRFLALQDGWRRGVESAGTAGGYGRMWKAARSPDLRSVPRLRFPQPTTTTWKKPCFFLSPLENPTPSPPPGFSTAPTPPRRRKRKRQYLFSKHAAARHQHADDSCSLHSPRSIRHCHCRCNHLAKILSLGLQRNTSRLAVISVRFPFTRSPAHAAATRSDSSRSRWLPINFSLSYRAGVVNNLKITLWRCRDRAINAATVGLGWPS